MNKLDKEFKEEFDNDLREGTYAIRKVVTRFLIGIAVLAILCSLGRVGYTFTIDKWQVNAEREVFKKTTAYSEGAATFLADSYAQYNEAQTKNDKNTIMEYVIMRYPNLDIDSIDNDMLKKFYNQCLNN